MSTAPTPDGRNEWVERFTAYSYDVDPDGRLRFVSLAKMLQEAAWQHAKALGKGFADRSEGSLFWVLSRLRVRVTAYPKWRETIDVATWPVGIDRVLATREFRIAGDGGALLGRAFSGWLVVDGSASRPVRAKNLVDDIRTEPSEMNIDLRRLDEVRSDEGVDRVVQYHDIDLYNHANNTAYIEWMLDAVPADYLSSHRIVEADFDFIKETRLGQSVRIISCHTADTVRSEVRHSATGECSCRSRLLFA